MSAKRLIIKSHQIGIVNQNLRKIYETPYKLLNSLIISSILSNANIPICFFGG